MLYYKNGVSKGNRPYNATTQECSGICRTLLAANSNYLWGESDSPANALVAYSKIDASSGGTITLTGVSVTDVEDIACATINGVNYIYLADTGDNNNNRASINIVRVVEPTITGSDISTSNFITINCVYPGVNGPTHKDAETLLVDPVTGKIYIITKRDSTVKLYSLDHQTSYTGQQTLVYEGAITAPPLSQNSTGSGTGGYIVGGDIAPDGKHIVIKNYTNIYILDRNPATQTVLQALQGTLQNVNGYVGGGLLSNHPYNEPFGEGVCFDVDLNLWTASEAEEGSSSSSFPLFYYERVNRVLITATFQDGLNSYSGTLDTYVQSLSANQGTNRGSDTNFIADYNSGTDERYALIKWDISTIPSNAKVISASIFLTVDVEGNKFEVREMLQNWNESSTYTSLSGLPSFDGVDADISPFETHENYFNLTGDVQINPTISMIQAWVSGTRTNNGILITNPSTSDGNGFQFRSRNHATQASHPKLIIEYYTDILPNLVQSNQEMQGGMTA
jgi:hypothetical protein